MNIDVSNMKFQSYLFMYPYRQYFVFTLMYNPNIPLPTNEEIQRRMYIADENKTLVYKLTAEFI